MATEVLHTSSLSACSDMGLNNYCQFVYGDRGTNLIISVPHGGHLLPPNIPDRGQYGSIVNGKVIWSHADVHPKSTRCKATLCNDEYSRMMAVALARELKKSTGKRPHVIVNHLHRKKLDANREICEATYGVNDTRKAYLEFHGFIEAAKSMINGRGLLIDIHGQSHSEQWVELGYVVSHDQMNTNTTDSNHSSIRNLALVASRRDPQISFDRLLRGDQSLGSLLQGKGYKTIPSPAHPSPGKGNYFNGGYTVKQHGSMNGGLIDAIQIEIPKAYRSQESYQPFCRALASSINTFMDMHYN